jgi:hypothetical protein
MNLTELMSLKPIWDFLSNVLSDIAKTRFKPEGSVEVARRRAFALYETLGRIKSESDFFVSELQMYSQSIEEKEYGQALVVNELINPESSDLRAKSILKSAKRLMKLLDKLADDLDLINPQLEIHQPLLMNQIGVTRIARAEVIGILKYRSPLHERYINSLYLKDSSIKSPRSENKKFLKRLVAQAKRNRILIRKAIDEYRNFLAKEFPFKESF